MPAGKHGDYTVLFEDRIIMKKCDEFTPSTGKPVVVNDEEFWTQSKYQNIMAIQFTNDATDNDQVEYNDRNAEYDEATLGSFQAFVDKFDAAYLMELQENWDNDNVAGETEAEKITRLGARPTSYTSTPIA